MKITIAELQKFVKKSIDKTNFIQGYRFGQAFCNEFGITYSKLFYCTDHEVALNIIWQNYVEI